MPRVGKQLLAEQVPDRRRDHAYRHLTVVVATLLLPLAALVTRGGRVRERACEWAFRVRYPFEDLSGLTPGTRAAFIAARYSALWHDAQLIGLTSGHRMYAEQREMFDEALRRHGSVSAARHWVLPPEESSHVSGRALDIRPTEGARWLEHHGDRFGLYRTYDNEWWHFEYWPDFRGTGRQPPRRPTPGH
ncbi:M15 family metallopeptidase [Kutzneria sp. CA-103260]|uniref:M15 family metallopeptidase n=1 Tax=Kutzneria sp. CA-103260 TaxID=2802641 RepID=UPI001BF03C69|nr:M15 family metallopeptidase [Kutzneria sp. CA-103260]QUQ71072.1 D-alanyl-D-alanine carboxypeptidase [Kutzneria sp. CA-103260]